MDFTNRAAREKKKLEDAKKKQDLVEAFQQNPRIKSLKLTGSRLAIRVARQAKSAPSTDELLRLSVAQSTIATAMTIVEDDFQRANRLLDMARSLANGNAKEPEDGQ